MAKVQSKRRLIVAIVVLAVILLVIGGVVIAQRLNNETSVSSTDSSKDATAQDTESDADESKDTPDIAETTETEPATVDPETLASIAIEPLGVMVYYSKGTPGFGYSVMKTTDKTEYAQFTSADLVGTKCTNDEGAFASIIKNPSTSESQTTSKTVKVGEDTFGLSLASAGCTANTELLTKYQTGFEQGFSSLKAL